MTEEKISHSIYGASCAKTWRNCPGSIQAICLAKDLGDIPQEQETEYTREGTEAHEWAEKCLLGKADLSEVPDEMREHIAGYHKYCMATWQEMKKSGFVEIHVEAKVPLWYRPKDKGVCDLALLGKDKIFVLDYKHGIGHHVKAEENDQLCIYGASFVYHLESKNGAPFPDDFDVVLGIYQPRHYLFDGPDLWTTTVRDLKDIALDIEADYKLALDPDVDALIPSHEACMFCDLKKVCTARAKTNFGGLPSDINPFEEFEDETEDVDFVQKAKALKAFKSSEGTLTPEQIAFICNHGKEIKKLVDDVTTGEKARLMSGGDAFGVKLIKGQDKPRQWVDEEAAEKLIKGRLGANEAYHPRKFITAPQALSKLKGEELSTRFKNKLDALIHRPPGEPKMVHIDAKGEPYTPPKPVDDLDVEETEEENFDDLL